MTEIHAIMTATHDAFSDDTIIAWADSHDPDLGDALEVRVIASGLDSALRRENDQLENEVLKTSLSGLASESYELNDLLPS